MSGLSEGFGPIWEREAARLRSALREFWAVAGELSPQISATWRSPWRETMLEDTALRLVSGLESF